MKQKNALIGLALMLCVLFLTACNTSAPVEPAPGSYTFHTENYPRVGGSLALLPLAEAVTATTLGIPRIETGNYVKLEGSTTSNYYALINGEFDLLLAYEPSQDALQYAEDAGFEWEITPIGRDALVFIANRSNPVGQLTDEQIRQIYSGKISNWQELGGDNAEIIPYQRNKDSGSQTLFDKLIPLGGELMTPPSEQIVGSMIGLLDVVAEYDNAANALGYTVYYYLTNMETDKYEKAKILTINGVECNNETIQSGAYPYTNDFYVVIPAGLAEDDPARVLAQWICSEQGRELAQRENYVTLE